MSNIKVVDFSKKKAMGTLYCNNDGLGRVPTFGGFGPKFHFKGGYSVGKSSR